MKYLQKNQRPIFFSIIFILIAGFITYNSTKPQVVAPSTNTQEETPQVQEITVTQSIYLTQEKKDPAQKTTKFAQGTTALDALEKEFHVVKTGKGKNSFVTEINGTKASETDRTFWALYVNKKQSELGAGSYTLKDKDNIEWKLETY